MFKKKSNYKLSTTNKGISPIIAISLLFVVSVFAVITFQTWFQTFQSSINANTQTQSSNLEKTINIENIFSGNTLYLKNPNLENIIIQKISINGIDCHVSGLYNKQMNEIYLDNCTSIGINDILIVTDKNIINKKINLKQGWRNPCPEGFVLVPGNDYFETSNFCVMEFEAKNISGIPKSQANLDPWVNITFNEAYIACSNLGTNYKLITNREWMTIARNIEKNPQNWVNEILGLNISQGGGLFRGNVNLNDILSCGSNIVLDGITQGQNCIITGGIQDGRNKRILKLSNEKEIWDLSGNIWEFVDLNEDGSVLSNADACATNSFRSYYGNDDNVECIWQNLFAKTNASDKRFEMGPLGNYNTKYGIGRIRGNDNLNRILRRGGDWADGENAGLFSTILNIDSNTIGIWRGFRCTFTP